MQCLEMCCCYSNPLEKNPKISCKFPINCPLISPSTKPTNYVAPMPYVCLCHKTTQALKCQYLAQKSPSMPNHQITPNLLQLMLQGSLKSPNKGTAPQMVPSSGTKFPPTSLSCAEVEATPYPLHQNDSKSIKYHIINLYLNLKIIWVLSARKAISLLAHQIF